MPSTQNTENTDEIELHGRGGHGSHDHEPDGEEARIGRAHPRELEPEDEEVIGRPHPAGAVRGDDQDTTYRALARPSQARQQADAQLGHGDVVDEHALDEIVLDDLTQGEGPDA